MPLPLIDPSLHRDAAHDRERAGAEGDARRARGAAAVLERLPRAGRRPAAARCRRGGRRSAGARAPARRSWSPGTWRIHRELEARLAELKGTEACVLFGSGFLANTGVIAALATDGVVARDELNHASIVDGCRLARAQTLVYPHGDGPASGADVIVTDAVFSHGRRRRAAANRAGRDRRAGDRRRGARDRRDRRRRAAGWCTSSACRRGHHGRHAREGARQLRRVRLLRRARSPTSSSTARAR